MKLMIATPSGRDWKFGFGRSLFDLGIHLTKKEIDFELATMHPVSNLSLARQTMAAEANKRAKTHILFIDDDMGFNCEAFDILASRDLIFVGANCVKKSAALEAIAHDLNGEILYSSGKTGIEKISKLGLGFTLVNMEAFVKTPAPHFIPSWSHNKDKQTLESESEDTYFCRLLREHKIDLYVDHDAARHVVHIGDFNYQENFRQ